MWSKWSKEYIIDKHTINFCYLFSFFSMLLIRPIPLSTSFIFLSCILSSVTIVRTFTQKKILIRKENEKTKRKRNIFIMFDDLLFVRHFSTNVFLVFVHFHSCSLCSHIPCCRKWRSDQELFWTYVYVNLKLNFSRQNELTQSKNSW